MINKEEEALHLKKVIEEVENSSELKAYNELIKNLIETTSYRYVLAIVEYDIGSGNMLRSLLRMREDRRKQLYRQAGVSVNNFGINGKQ